MSINHILPQHILILALVHAQAARPDTSASALILPDSVKFDLLSFCYETIQQSTPWTWTFQDAQTRLSEISCSSGLEQTVLNSLAWLDSPESLVQFVSEMPSRLFDDGSELPRLQRMALIQPASFLGVFLRKLSLVAKRLSFHELMTTYDRWRDYVQDAEHQETAAEASIGLDTKDLFMHLLNKTSSIHTSPLNAQFTSAMHGEALTSSDTEQNYLLFLQAWKRGDYSSSLAQLSRYFDYTVSMTGKSSYQYALLNLALLQSDFGCHKEALWAIYETIDAARDHQDDICLSFALSWLSEISAKDPELMQHDASLQNGETGYHVIQRAHDNNLPAIQSLAYLARHRSETGQTALENVLRSQRVTLQANENTTLSQFLAFAEVWKQLDVPELRTIYLRLASTYCDTRADTEEAARLICTISQDLINAGYFSAARSILSGCTAEAMKNHAYHRLIIIQKSILALATPEDENASAREDELLESMHIENDPIRVEARVVRYLSCNRTADAWEVLNKHLTPQSIPLRNPLYKATYLRLACETFMRSQEPERALGYGAKAMQCAAEHALYREFRLARNLVHRVAKIFKQS